MNLSILSTSRHQELDFAIEIPTLSFYHNTTMTIRGDYGQMGIHKIDLTDCHIWIITSDVKDAHLFKSSSITSVLQLCFIFPPYLEDTTALTVEMPKGQPPLTVQYTFQVNPYFQFQPSYKKCLLLYYAASYLSSEQIQLLERLHQRRSLQGAGNTIIPDAPLLLVLQQILSFPPEDAHLPRYLKAKTEELLVHFLKLAEASFSSLQHFSDAEIEKLQQVIQIIKAAPAENVTPYQLAKKVGINVHTLKLKFREYTGYTTYQFILRTRMEMAQRLLEETDTPITEIAALCGYKNHPNFSETFKKHFGIPPNALRKKG